MRAVRFVVSIMIAGGLAGCGSEKDPAMPDITGKKLDVAQSDIERAGFEDEVEVLGGGVFGVLDESNWEVCEQTPAPGMPLTEPPRLTIERDCNTDDTSSKDPSPEPEVTDSATPTAEPTLPPTQATDITVDELLDKLNSRNMGGIKSGDRFKLTAELFESDAWGVGAAGEFTVYMKAKGGADDLLVFVDEADADGWRDGTRVEMVLEVVEATINGETTDGWLKARTVKTLPGR